MSVIQIKKVQREGARLIIGIAGVSGSGKTRTAIELAYGLAGGNAEKIGFLDTENRRGSLYADVLPAPFLIGDLYAPFSPQRYIDAIHEFQRAGVEVLIIDSVTHEWEGTGGCQEIAANTTSRMADWKKAKAEHKRFMNAMLQCDMHIICCIRAREKTDFKDPRNPVNLGLQPIQEGNFMFEMTASVMMHEMGSRQDVLKCPAELLPILGRGAGYITQSDGSALRGWIMGAKQLDPEVEHYRNMLQSNTERGIEHLRASWAQTPPNVRTALGAQFLETLKSAAAEFDRQRADEKATESTALAAMQSLNDKAIG